MEDCILQDPRNKQMAPLTEGKSEEVSSRIIFKGMRGMLDRSWQISL